MTWYAYLACFFAGAVLANAVPHFVHGISGNRFPTPFAHPRGRGLSSPTLNMIWALANLVIGTVLFHVGHISHDNISTLIVFFAGIAVLGLVLSVRFATKHTE